MDRDDFFETFAGTLAALVAFWVLVGPMSHRMKRMKPMRRRGWRSRLM